MIYKINYLDIDYKDSLNYNMLFFKKDDRGLNVKIPEISKYQEQFSPWRVAKNKTFYTLNINSNNELFNTSFEMVYFKNDEKKMLGVKLLSDSLEIEAYKFHQDYLIDGINW